MEFWSLHFPSISQLGIGQSSLIKGCTLCPNEYHTATVCPIRGQMFIPESVELIPRSSSRSSPSQPDRSRKSFSRRPGAADPPDRFKSTKSFRPRPSKSSTTKVCDFFNSPRGCKKKGCDYYHRCSRCKAASHGIYFCPN
jgi:hypothetical protein